MADKPVLVFDVNETILDLEKLQPAFERKFGDAGVLRRWFSELIIASQALSLAGAYVPFGELGGGTLRKLGAIRNVDIGDADIDEISEAVAAMPPYPEVDEALRKLKGAGFRLVTLTNNPLETAKRQLEHGGIAKHFEAFFSVDGTVNRYKPAPETYELVERELDLPPEALMLIACHDWDVLGASARGWQSVMIERPDNATLPTGPQPDFVMADLRGVASELIERYR